MRVEPEATAVPIVEDPVKRSLVVIPFALAMLVLALPVQADEPIDPYPVAPQVVGTDAAGDWGDGGNQALVGHALGQDLVGASIGMPNADTVVFTMEVSFLPSGPGVAGYPEVSRYTWDMLVDGEFVELDGKFTNYSRGACDPTSGQCNPLTGKLPRDPGPAPFLVRGNCAPNEGNVTVCEELGLVEATFNATANTIRVAVPADLLEIEECSTIKGATNLFGGSISATPSAFVTSSLMPLDFMDVRQTFQVPTTDPAGCA